MTQSSDFASSVLTMLMPQGQPESVLSNWRESAYSRGRVSRHRKAANNLSLEGYLP